MSDSNNSFFQFLHATYRKDADGDAVVALLKNIKTGEPQLKIFENPKRTVGITRKGVQELHDSKKIYEDMNNLDIYTVHNYLLREELQRLVMGYTGGYVSFSNLMNNPYVYGADIDMPVLIKQSYMNQTDEVCSRFRIGGLDIETAVPGVMSGREIILISYVSPELKIYTAVLEAFIGDKDIDSVKKRAIEELQKKIAQMNPETKAIVDSNPIDITLRKFGSEVEMISWIFSIIHQDKPEFVSIWNIDYDIPFILNRLQVLGANPYPILCHPDVPSRWRVCNYNPDRKKNVQHFSHKWHLFELSGYTQFYDGMCLYSILRKHAGNLESYALEAISEEVIGVGKMDLQGRGHYEMQSSHPEEYTAYNAIDPLLNVLIEKRVNDVQSMVMILRDSDICSFARQSVQLRDWFYNYCKKHNKMSASWRGRILHPTDEEIVNVGGCVLDPDLSWRAGVIKIKELIGTVKDAVSKLMVLVSDIDVAFSLKESIGAL